MNLYFLSSLHASKKSAWVVLLFTFTMSGIYAQTGSPKPANGSFTIENYYKAKWGYADEFISLWKKNHYPLLKKAQEKGDIISVTAEKPKLHSGEDTRWDFKVILVFKDAKTAFDEDLTPLTKSNFIRTLTS